MGVVIMVASSRPIREGPAFMNVADRPNALLTIAREIASANPDFQAALGPGEGNLATNAFLDELQKRARFAFGGADFSEQKVSGDNSLAVDFYFPEEATIVEVALGLPNPASEFEKDILKAIMAQERGHEVKRLFFISRPGAAKKCSQPGRTAMKDWVAENHSLQIEIHELSGEPRRRLSRSARLRRRGA
jgi:hypothetical protein